MKLEFKEARREYKHPCPMIELDSLNKDIVSWAVFKFHNRKNGEKFLTVERLQGEW